MKRYLVTVVLAVAVLSFSFLPSSYAYSTYCNGGQCIFQNFEAPLKQHTLLQFTYEKPSAKDKIADRYIKGQFSKEISNDAFIQFDVYLASDMINPVVTHNKVTNYAADYYYYDLTRDGLIDNEKYVIKISTNSNIDLIKTRTASWNFDVDLKK